MATPDETDNLSPETIAADEEEAQAPHTADREPTPEEEAAAPTSVDPGVAEAYDEANKTGAHVKGEGEI